MNHRSILEAGSLGSKARCCCLLLLLGASLAQAGAKQEHRDCLRLWVSDDPAIAIEDLSASHRQHRHAHQRQPNPWLTNARQAARKDPQAVVPVIAVQVDLYGYQLHHRLLGEESIFQQLLAESESTLVELIDLYLEEVERRQPESLPAARRIAAGFWAGVGEAYRSRELLAETERYFRRATEVDPTCLEALHTYGCVLEKLALYNEAADAFGKILEQQPDHHEASLRRALCDARRHRTGQAAERLQRLADSNGPAWVRLLAFQEQVRLLVEQQLAEQAVAVVRRALQQFPDSERLHLQLLHLLDDRSAESYALLDHLIRVERQPTAASPRVQYNQWPTTDIDALFEQLFLDIEQRIPLLVAALDLDIGTTGPKDQP